MQLFCAAACFLFTAVVSLKTSKLAYGSDSDVFDVSLLCSLTVFSEGRCVALLPFQSGARIFMFTSQRLLIGINLRLDDIHLRSEELFSEGHCLVSRPFRSGGVYI